MAGAMKSKFWRIGRDKERIEKEGDGWAWTVFFLVFKLLWSGIELMIQTFSRRALF
jgi:hypothetical protein